MDDNGDDGDDDVDQFQWRQPQPPEIEHYHSRREMEHSRSSYLLRHAQKPRLHDTPHGLRRPRNSDPGQQLDLALAYEPGASWRPRERVPLASLSHTTYIHRRHGATTYQRVTARPSPAPWPSGRIWKDQAPVLSAGPSTPVGTNSNCRFS